MTPERAETYQLVAPDGLAHELVDLPIDRASALEIVISARRGPGRYQFTKMIDDPEYGSFAVGWTAVDIYPSGIASIAQSAPGVSYAHIGDLHTYLQHRVCSVRAPDESLKLSHLPPSSQDNAVQDDLWLLVSAAAAGPIAQFVIRVTGYLELPAFPESNQPPTYHCSLPSVRSIGTFIRVAADIFGQSGLLSVHPLHPDDRSRVFL